MFISRLNDWQKITLALVLGVIAGFLLPGIGPALAPFGDLFLNAVKMLLIPVIVTALVNAMISLSNMEQIKKIFTKAMMLYFISMLSACLIGLVVAELLLPTHLSTITLPTDHVQATQALTYHGFIANLLPSNPVAALTSGNTLQVVILAIIIGIAINLTGEKSRLFKQGFLEAAQIVHKVVSLIMHFAPIGVFCIITSTVAQFGWSILLQLMSFTVVTWAAFLIYYFFYYGSLLFFFGRVSLIGFIKDILPAIILAFSTSSSAATLPQTFICAEQTLRIDRSLCGFLLPLGSVMNMNGLAVYLAVAAVFTAHLYGVVLSSQQLLMTVITIVISSFGIGGIPSAGLIVLSAILSTVNLPLAVIPLLASIDRLIDMPQTSINTMSNISACYLLAKIEKKIDVSNQKVI